MTYKWIRKYLLTAISLGVFGIVFSCKGTNTPQNPDVPGGGGDGGFKVSFSVVPRAGGEIEASVDGKPIQTGSMVKKDSEVVFNLILKGGDFIVENWSENVTVERNNPLKARLKVVKNESVFVSLKTNESEDPELRLLELNIYNKLVDISDLENIKVEVEDFIETLSSNDITGIFNYGTHRQPEEISVKVDKDRLAKGETLVRLSVPPVEKKYKFWTQLVKITRKEAPEKDDIFQQAQVEAIEVALLPAKKKGGRYTYEDYVALGNFVSEKPGPYKAQDALTAYVAVRVKKEKPESGNDYDISLENKSTYLPSKKLVRGKGNEASYLELKEVVLAKGYNTLEITVKSPDGSQVGVYTVTVEYDGGPELLELPLAKRKMLPGVYCPAQRRHAPGETPDYVWFIGIAGW